TTGRTAELLQRIADSRQQRVAVKPHFHPGLDLIQAPPPTHGTALACRQGLMVADHVHGTPVALGALTAMARAAFSGRRSAVAYIPRSTRSTRILIAVSGHCVWILTLFGLRAKQHHPEPFEAERRLLQ